MEYNNIKGDFMPDLYYWKDADGNDVDVEFIKKEIEDYVAQGGKIYVGTDSMLFPNKCNFATVIAFHNRSAQYVELQAKILEEVSLAIQTAQFVLEMCPQADIELHIDIGTNKKRNATARFFKTIQGWVSGTGFDLRVKPDSWASSLADGHTKRRRG